MQESLACSGVRITLQLGKPMGSNYYSDISCKGRSTTIDLCQNVFWWTNFRKYKEGIKIHTLYNIEKQIPIFSTSRMHLSTIWGLWMVPYETGSYYIFDQGYNDFKRLYKIGTIKFFFVVRAKKSLQYKTVRWKCCMPGNVLSDILIDLLGFYPQKYYPKSLRLVCYGDEEQ